MGSKEKKILDEELIKKNPGLLASTLSETEYAVLKTLLDYPYALTAKGIQHKLALRKLIQYKKVSTAAIAGFVEGGIPWSEANDWSASYVVKEARRKKLPIPSNTTIQTALDGLLAQGLVETKDVAKTKRTDVLYYASLRLRSVGVKLD